MRPINFLTNALYLPAVECKPGTSPAPTVLAVGGNYSSFDNLHTVATSNNDAHNEARVRVISASDDGDRGAVFGDDVLTDDRTILIQFRCQWTPKYAGLVKCCASISSESV